ncbi:hypothetical protein ASG04_11345 [Curtobacterium sp. Leaf183]|uniref:hypothetical protein n=1 Tax=Curtobacterium sp. Leaf183 TaxID=1736291 RepID=UPI0006F3E9EE|nr:hypothetical protein [Curtobacterium sp. Leaf183]KQS07784.1 hypothetical protein ASG04_11345 [Curtobacterium sp. Leaf183]
MPDNNDTILLESVRTHRVRLRGAFLIGELAERRTVNDNVRRLVGSMVLAAVVCAGCVGTAFVLNAIQNGQAGGLGGSTGTTSTTAPASGTSVGGNR